MAELAGVNRDELEAVKVTGQGQAIYHPAELVPAPDQAMVLEQAGLPPGLWEHSEYCLRFLTLPTAASRLTSAETTRLSARAEACLR